MSVKITETAAEALISKLDRLVAKNEAIFAAALKDFRAQYMEILSAHTAEKGEAEPVAWCQPMDNGAIRPRMFIIHFEDASVGYSVFENEDEAYAYWERANLNWNCTLFGAMPRDRANPPAPRDDLVAEVERLRAALHRMVSTYTGMENGDGNPCPDVEFARAALEGRTDA